MNRDELVALQAPLKERYREDPDAARITLRASGRLGEGVTCSIETGRALIDAGLHPATGGDGTWVCSGDMLLEALAACAGVTMGAVATSLSIPLRGGTVAVEGDLDFKARWRSTRKRRSVLRHPRAFRPRHGRRPRSTRHTPAADGAVLRRRPDAAPVADTEDHPHLTPTPSFSAPSVQPQLLCATHDVRESPGRPVSARLWRGGNARERRLGAVRGT